ncbi:MAG TPA: DUF4870 domain-containing protein [Anaerohalosphaeraceae bacterium]|nr:DUF4870 domain-containing protein [Anaerohalosphaeraceae bacterium]HOL90028.1 DUF4870 domain-containing protein [Anaerohalosphaeraceae bacterium]HPP57397.1 DUF4870 domain-containing protein [Anaerohalosphaeraceae bacterium]
MDQNMEGQNPAAAPNESATPSKDALNLAVLCHVLGFFTSFLGPLILWLMKKDGDAYVEHHGREALNFQITLLIAYLVGGILSFVCIGFVIIAAAWIADIVFSILAAVAASKGQRYQYPVSLRLIK